MKACPAREEALALLKKYNSEPFHIQHALTVEGVMRWYANELGYGEDADFWATVGLLHDVDFEKWPEQHCVKAPELLQEIEKAAGRLELCQDILLEVNIGGEAAKSGFSPDQIHAAAEMARALPHVQVRGLMTIPPVAAEPHGNLAYFEKMRWLYVDINAKIYDNKMEYLSMGMSGDFADAIRCGSNMIRVGTAIFGARDYTK